jgi:hypothetical protein
MGTMRWRVAVFAGTILVSPASEASTELHGGAWFCNDLGYGETTGDVRADPGQLALPKLNSSELSAPEDATADTWAHAVDRALLGGGSATTTDARKPDRFGWVFLLIGFAGLTAFFAGRRTGARGLTST